MFASGDSPVPEGLMSVVFGKSNGSCSSGTAHRAIFPMNNWNRFTPVALTAE